MSNKGIGKVFLIMGVSSTGKSSIGESLAKQLDAKFIDGDDLHPKSNILKMVSGHPLNDDDRKPWLERIRDAAFSIETKNELGVIVCSALKRQYRDQICEGNKSVNFLHLHGDFELVKQRMLARKGHFMPIELLQSQFDTLEMPANDEHNVFQVDIEGDFNTVITRCLQQIDQIKQKDTLTTATTA